MQLTCLLQQRLQQHRCTGLDSHLMSASPTVLKLRSISTPPLSNQVCLGLHNK